MNLGSENSSTACPNDAWTVDATDTCVPKPENFILQCQSNGIEIELSKALIPDAKEVFLGNCPGSFDAERQGWHRKGHNDYNVFTRDYNDFQSQFNTDGQYFFLFPLSFLLPAIILRAFYVEGGL